MTYRTFDRCTGKEIHYGDMIKSSDGRESAIFSRATRPSSKNSRGLIEVICDDGRCYEYYDSVFGLIVAESTNTQHSANKIGKRGRICRR